MSSNFSFFFAYFLGSVIMGIVLCIRRVKKRYRIYEQEIEHKIKILEDLSASDKKNGSLHYFGHERDEHVLPKFSEVFAREITGAPLGPEIVQGLFKSLIWPIVLLFVVLEKIISAIIKVRENVEKNIDRRMEKKISKKLGVGLLLTHPSEEVRKLGKHFKENKNAK